MAKRQAAGSRRPTPAPPSARSRPVTDGLPWWLAPVVYSFVTLVLFRDFFLGGISMLGQDSIALSYFARNFYTEFIQLYQRMPYWNPLLFGGLPFVEGMHGDIFYPPSLALFFMDADTMWGWKMALHVLLAGLFMHLWLKRGLGVRPVTAFLGGLVYMMGAHLVSLVLPGGDGKLFVAALAPLLFWLTERAVSGCRLADFAALALGIALILFTSHMQAAYYCVWGISLYFLFRTWENWRTEGSGAGAARAIGLFALAGVLGVGGAAVQFLPPLGYLREYSHRVERAEERGYEWSSTYSLHAEEVVALAVPEFVGEIAQTSVRRPPAGYWGRNPLKLNSEYAGLIPLLLIPVLLAGRRGRRVWFFTVLAALALLYALASSTPFGRLFYLIPGVSLFRAWSIIIFLYALAVVTLAAIAVDRMVGWLEDGRAEADRERARRVLWIAAGVMLLLAVLASTGGLAALWRTVFFADMPDYNAQVLALNSAYITRGFWIAFALSAAVAGIWHLATKGALSARAFVLILAVLAALDLYRVDRPFVRQTALMNEQLAGSTLLRADDVIEQLQRLRDAGGVFRVADLSGLVEMRSPYNANDFAIHGLEQLGGHHGNEMGRWRNLIGGEALQNMLTTELRLAGLTNTEYLVLPARVQDPRLEEVYAGAQAVIYRYADVLPRAFLVGSAEVLGGSAGLERYLSPDFDPRSTVILEEAPGADVELSAGASGIVEWQTREPDRYSLRVVADRPSMLVVLDGYYPAWKALVDGREVPVRRANYAFRAVPVPAGEHTVSFRYSPDALRSGALISLAILALLLVVVLWGWRTRDAKARPAG